MTTKNSIEKYWLYPLFYFDCYQENVELLGNVQIKRVHNEFMAFLEKHNYIIPWSHPSHVKWMILFPNLPSVDIQDNKGKKVPALNRLHPEIITDDLKTSLRLCHQGDFSVGPVIAGNINNSVWEIGDTIFPPPISETAFWAYQPDPSIYYKFNKNDTNNVNKLMEYINILRLNKNYSVINIALERFNSAYNGEFENRLIDQMIAFETLYLGDDKELGYKLALRTAFLLGKNRVTIFKNMKKAYELRGKIVHGQKQLDWAELAEIVDVTQEYLRQSIRKFLLLLTKRISMKEIRNKLDENILSNGKTLAEIG